MFILIANIQSMALCENQIFQTMSYKFIKLFIQTKVDNYRYYE